MKLFEIQAKGYKWWIVAEEEIDVLTYLRDELYALELADEEIDEALEDPYIRKLTKRQAISINVVDEYGDKLYSLWTLFESSGAPGVLTSDFNKKYNEDDEDFDYEFSW
jgi:hypothetical protein